MSRGTGRKTLWLTGVAHGLAHGWELVFPAVAVPMAADLGMDFEQVVMLPFVSYLLLGLGAVPAGWATDRFGGRSVLLVCLLAGGASAVSVAFAEGTGGLVLALAGVGLAASLYHPAGLTLIAERFAERPGRAFALNGIAGNVGIAATPLLAALLAAIFDWRMAFVVLGLPGLLAGVWFLAAGDEEAPDPGRVPRSRPPKAPEPPSELRRDRPHVGALLVLAVAVLCGGLSYRLHTVVLPALLQERIPALGTWVRELAPGSLNQVTNLAAAALTSLAYSVGVFGHWWGGKAADAMPVTRSYLLFRAGGFAPLVVAAAASGFWVLPGLIGYVVFNQGMQPSENRLVPRFVPDRMRGRAYAGKFLLGLGGGSLALFLVPWISREWGLGATLWAVAGFEGVIVCAALLLTVVARRP